MVNLYRIRAEWTGVTGSPFVNVMHFLEASGTASQAASAMRTFLLACQGQISSSLTLSIDPEVRIIDSTTGQAIGSTSVAFATAAGSSGHDMLPRGTSLKCIWRTGSFAGGREIKGATYIPGITEQYNGVTGTPDAVVAGSLNGGAAALIADANSDLVVYRRTTKTWQGVSSGTAAPRWSRLLSRVT